MRFSFTIVPHGFEPCLPAYYGRRSRMKPSEARELKQQCEENTNLQQLGGGPVVVSAIAYKLPT